MTDFKHLWQESSLSDELTDALFTVIISFYTGVAYFKIMLVIIIEVFLFSFIVIIFLSFVKMQVCHESLLISPVNDLNVCVKH